MNEFPFKFSWTAHALFILLWLIRADSLIPNQQLTFPSPLYVWPLLITTVNRSSKACPEWKWIHLTKQTNEKTKKTKNHSRLKGDTGRWQMVSSVPVFWFYLSLNTLNPCCKRCDKGMTLWGVMQIGSGWLRPRRLISICSQCLFLCVSAVCPCLIYVVITHTVPLTFATIQVFFFLSRAPALWARAMWPLLSELVVGSQPQTDSRLLNVLMWIVGNWKTRSLSSQTLNSLSASLLCCKWEKPTAGGSW